MGAEPMKAIREETVENCLQELQRRSNFHNVPELTYALTYARSCLKAILENAEHSELAELFKAAYGRDIRDFVPQCVDDAVPSGLGVLLFPKPDVIVPKLLLAQPVL